MRVYLLMLAWLMVCSPALAGVPFELPADEVGADWVDALALGGLEAGKTSVGPRVVLIKGPERWTLVVFDINGQRHEVDVRPVLTSAQREEVAFLAASLVHPILLPPPAQVVEPDVSQEAAPIRRAPAPPAPAPAATPGPDMAGVSVQPVAPEARDHAAGWLWWGVGRVGVGFRDAAKVQSRFELGVGARIPMGFGAGLHVSTTSVAGLTGEADGAKIWTLDAHAMGLYRLPGKPLQVGVGFGVGVRRFTSLQDANAVLLVPSARYEVAAPIALSTSVGIELALAVLHDLSPIAYTAPDGSTKTERFAPVAAVFTVGVTWGR